MDREKASSNNSGIASKYRLIDEKVFGHENNVQKEITVDSIRLDDWCKTHNVRPNLIWMDAQGAELDILRGAENSLRDIQAILTEVGLKSYYNGQSLKTEIDEYLANHGFFELESGYVQRHEFEADTIYVNRNFIKS